MKIAKALRDGINADRKAGKLRRIYRVYVDFDGRFEDSELGAAGLSETLGGQAGGSLTADQIKTVADLPGVRHIWLPERQSLDLNETVPHIRANQAWLMQNGPDLKGRGVAIAIIDSGIDVLHESFQDGAGNTRILALWDQTFSYDAVNGAAVDKDDNPLTGGDIPTDELGAVVNAASNRTPAVHPTMPGNNPNPQLIRFDYGVEFTRAQIDTALSRNRNDGQNIPISLRDDPQSSNHGTHVAGIAAGDGSQPGNCQGSDTFVGVAPEADLIIVKIGFSGAKFQDTLAAVEYAVAKARTAVGGAIPLSVNMSLGSQIGPHNGFSSWSESTRTLLAGSQGEAIIRSAGNSRNDAIHAAVTVAAGSQKAVDFVVARKNSQVQFWMSFNAGADFKYALTLPGRAPRVQTPQIDNTDDASFNQGDHSYNPTDELSRGADVDDHCSLTITPRNADKSVKAGTWTLTFENNAPDEMHIHIWSSSRKAGFVKPSGVAGSAQDPDQPEDWLKATIGVDACSQDVIAVAAYDISGGSRTIAPFSSQGPAPSGLVLGLYPATSIDKPDIAAPGVGITSAKAEAFDCFLMCECCVSNYMDMQGTSQAAPHIAGVAALMLQADPTLTHIQIKQMLQDSADNPPPLDNNWPPASELFGAGTVDTVDAVQEVLDNLAAPRSVALEVARRGTRAASPTIQRISTIIQGWERRFGTQPAWHFCAGLVSRHFVEVQSLINKQKKVGAVWQRYGGPGLIRTIVFNQRDIDPPIPLEIDDKKMDTLISRLIPVLRRFAGPRLLADIERFDGLARMLPGRNLSEIDTLILRMKT